MRSAYRRIGRAMPVCLMVAALLGCARAPVAAEEPSADEVLECLDAPAGIVAVVGDGAVERAIRLARADDRLTVFVQVAGAEAADAARRAGGEAGLAGTRLVVSEGPLDRIHLADNVADVVVAAPADAVPRGELLRVLRPAGTAVVGGERVRKPYPEGADDWPHVYHGPDNNPQTEDRLARAPYLTQYVA